MAKIDQITEGISGEVAATRINEALKSVETTAEMTGDGTEGSEIQINKTSSFYKQSNRTQQTLVSGTTINMDVTNGVNAYLSLAHNGTIVMANLFEAAEGNIIIDNTGSFTLAISPTPYVIDGGAGAITLTSSGRDILSYYYDGTNLNITYGSNYTNS